MPPVTVYTKGWCPYCAAAKELLAAKGVAFEEIEITGREAEKAEMVRRSVVRQIFVGEEHIGGFDDLSALERSGRLDPLLAA